MGLIRNGEQTLTHAPPAPLRAGDIAALDTGGGGIYGESMIPSKARAAGGCSIMTRMLAGTRAVMLCVCAALAGGGCTTVVIHSAGSVRTEHQFGILKLSVDESHATSMAVSSVGISSVPGTVAVGWLQWKGVFLPPDDARSCLFVDFGSDEPIKE